MFVLEKIPELHGTRQGKSDFLLIFAYICVVKKEVSAKSYHLSLYTARPSFKYYGQVYFVHSWLQDESLQVTIWKLPHGS